MLQHDHWTGGNRRGEDDVAIEFEAGAMRCSGSTASDAYAAIGLLRRAARLV